MLEVVNLDPQAVCETTRGAAGFELLGLPFGLIEMMRALADSALPDYQAVLVLDAAMGAITHHHIYELHVDAQAREGADAVASWIQWVRRLPCLIMRSLLQGLAESGLLQRTATGDRPVPQLHVFDHSFGEEKLSAPAVLAPATEDFFDGCTMTALQAVALAKWAKEHPDEEPVSPNQTLSLTGAVKPAPLSDADALLLECATCVLERGEAYIAGGGEAEAAELAWADAFGRRNRFDFPLLNDRAHAGKLAYVDNAATAQRLGASLQAQAEFDLHGNANVYRGSYELSAQATFAYNAARKALEDFIGAERRSTVFCANTSAACALVAQAWGEWNVRAGDLIVTTIAEHHSNMLPFMQLAERKGARVEHVPVGPDGRIDQEAYRAALARGPKLVTVAHIGNVLGIEAPVREMAAEAHGVGARFLLDAAQSFPHRAIDVRELGADWVAFSAHKAYGPMGIGALWISPDAFTEMDPIVAGGGTVSHVATDVYYLRPKSIQYELGTPPISQAIGWAAAIGYLDALGMDAVERHAAVLTRYLVSGLHAVDGVTVMGDHTEPDGQNGLVAFTLCDVDPSSLAAFLGKLGVAIRAGSHCCIPLHASMGLIGTGRISFAVYTTRDDIDAALTAVEACRRLERMRA